MTPGYTTGSYVTGYTTEPVVVKRKRSRSRGRSRSRSIGREELASIKRGVMEIVGTSGSVSNRNGVKKMVREVVELNMSGVQ